MQNDLNTILSSFVYNLSYDNIDFQTLKTTKLFILDYFAACFAGMGVNKEFNDVVTSVIDEAEEKGICSVLLSTKKYSPATAAFLNAVYAHGADMDDGNKKAMGHIGCHVISTAFSVGEEIGASGKELLTAIIVGYEIYNRLAASVQPGLVRRGFHSTGTAGAIACAATAAKLYGCSESQIYNAISFAALQCSGLMIITESGQNCKPINPANAAKIGIFSAKCARKGLKAPRWIFESDKGWCHAMSDTFDPSYILDGLGSFFTINESYLKPYPSCRHTHCSIEAIETIRKKMLQDNYTSDDIDRIRIRIYKNAIIVAGQVIHPDNPEATKFSIHFTAACMMIKGTFGLNELNDYHDSEINLLIDKIELCEDDTMEDTKKGIRGASVEVILKDGTRYSETVLIPKGDAVNPMTAKDIVKKLYDARAILAQRLQLMI